METKQSNLRLVVGTSTARGMEDVIRECRAREQGAVRQHRIADAALYAEVASRAEDVLRRERELGYAREQAERDRTLREDLMRGRARFERIGAAALVGLALAALMLFLTGCAGMPPVRGPSAGTLEAYAGGAVPSARGSNDVADIGSYGLLGVGGSLSDADELTGAAGEWFLEGGRASGEVDAGELGLFDLEADVVRAGLGLRLGTICHFGMDWSLGLGACLTVASGEASAGSLQRDFDESGLGFYVSGTISRGPMFLRLMYVDGPEAEIEDESVQLGGASLVGGLRWTF